MPKLPRGQAEILEDLWPPEAEWFLIGGPADGNEAQVIRRRFPMVKIAGFEPNPKFLAHQRRVFPGILHGCALWDEDDTTLTLRIPKGATGLSGSVCRPQDAPDISTTLTVGRIPVTGRTLDSLSEQHGPFTNAVLWLDIEYAERAALKGATRMLEAGQVLMVNVETYAHRTLNEIVEFLYPYGLRLRRVWNVGNNPAHDAQDYIFTRDK